MNRALIRQNQELLLRGGIPEDVFPEHVSGGIPIQKYLKNLLDNGPGVLPADQFSLVSREPFDATVSGASDHPSIDSLTSAHYRDAFVDDLMRWIDRHVRVKVRIHGAERSVYVWQSFLDPPAESGSSQAEDSSVNESDEIDSLERNVSLESNENDVSTGSEPEVAPREMFQR